MNICLLSPTFLPKIGGAEIVVASLAEHLTQAGHNVAVVTQWPRRGKGVANDSAFAYPVIRYKRPWSFTLSLGMHSIWKALAEAHKKYRFDIIHCHLVYPVGYVGVKFGRKDNIPVIITAHGSDIRPTSRYRRKRIIWQRITNSLKNADHLTAISSQMKEILHSIADSKKVTCIPNGIDIEKLTKPVEYQPDWPIDAGQNFILYIGSLKHIKGIDILLQAVNVIYRQGGGEMKLIVAGKGQMRDELEQFVIDNDMQDMVVWVGEVTGRFKRYLLQNARFVVIPSRSESFSLVALEALSCGRPIIASAVGGLVDTIEDGKTGKLVPPENSQALADAIVEMWNSDCSEIQENAKNKAKLYDWRNITSQYIELYEKLHESRGEPMCSPNLRGQTHRSASTGG